MSDLSVSVWDSSALEGTSLRDDCVKVSGCGTSFLNGTYVRQSEKSYTRRVRHNGVIVSLELTQLDLQSVFNPNLNPFKPEPEIYEFRRYAWVEDPNTRYFDQAIVLRMNQPRNIHFYACANDGCEGNWHCIAGLEPPPRLTPVPNARHYFIVPYYGSDSRKSSVFAESVDHNNDDDNKDPSQMGVSESIMHERRMSVERNQRKKMVQTHKHSLKRRPTIFTTLVELGHGLQGGLAMTIDVNLERTVWELLRELADMNRSVGPFNIRLKCMDNSDSSDSYFRYVHQHWRMTLSEVFSMVRKERLASRIQRDSLARSGARYTASGLRRTREDASTQSVNGMEETEEETKSEDISIPIIKPYEDFIEANRLMDGSLSFQSRYHPCFEYLPEYDFESRERKRRKKETRMDPAKKTGFRLKAVRVWSVFSVRMRFGPELVRINLEECCANCSCWSDELCGQRLSYLIEKLFQIPKRNQGYILSDEFVDYLTPDFGLKLQQSDYSLVLFHNFGK